MRVLIFLVTLFCLLLVVLWATTWAFFNIRTRIDATTAAPWTLECEHVDASVPYFADQEQYVGITLISPRKLSHTNVE